MEKGVWGHLEISNKMESYGSRIFFFTIFEAILFFSTPLEPFYFFFFLHIKNQNIF